MFDTFFVCWWIDCFQCNKYKISHTDIKNNKNDTANIKNNLTDRVVLKCLNHNRIDLYFNTVQMTIFCFWMLFKVTDEVLITDSMKNIDVILWQYCHSFDFADDYFIIYNY